MMEPGQPTAARPIIKVRKTLDNPQAPVTHTQRYSPLRTHYPEGYRGRGMAAIE
jgi:hypothetical protein